MHSPKRTRLILPLQQATTQSECPIVIIEKLSDEVLLNIFRHYLDASPRFWLVLVHICRKWRRIVFASSQALHLRLFCTQGSPFLKALDYWPSLPIVVEYGGSLELDPPAPEDDDNIMAALERSDRISSISLTLTSSLLEKLFAIESPFSELEHLVLRPQDGHQPLTLPSFFGRSTRLRSLHLASIVFPALPLLLYSSKDLVDLQLHDTINPWLYSPEALTDALSGMAQLRSLSLHFFSFCVDEDPLPSGKRVILPSLSRLYFRGYSEYLEALVSRIDAPRLKNIEITFTNSRWVESVELSRFVDRTEMPKSHRQAHILCSEDAISISLMQPGALTYLTLQIPILYWGLGRIRARLSSFCFNVEELRINATQKPRWMNERAEWLGILDSFMGIKSLHIAGDLLTDANHFRFLTVGLRPRTVLLALHKLYIAQPGPRHAPLREAVVSLMTSRRLSGHPIEVEYESLHHVGKQLGPLLPSQKVMLCDDILLNIFRHYLDPTPQIWPTLTWVCQRWRQIVLKSPLGLNIRLYCTQRMHVSEALDCWPTLPIVIHYEVPNLDAPAPEDNDNIIAALKQSGRVSSINLTVTSSLLDKLPAISDPLSDLEELTLLSQDKVSLILPNTFRWGPRLRTLHSTRIAFPSFPQLLSPSHDLVDIQLHEIPSNGYFSPEAFANALSGMTNLRTLSLHFLSLPARRNYLGLPLPSGERVVLPTLMTLKYRGTSKYLDSLVARIDAPSLEDIDITFFSQPTMDASQLGRFIERTELQTSFSQADVQTSEHAISISFTSSGNSTPLRLQISCKQLDWQLSSMAQVCNQISPFLFRINNLGVNTTRPSTRLDEVDGEQWLELVRAFGGATAFRVAGELTIDIVCALGPADGEHATVLPALRYLLVNSMTMNEPSWDALLSFINSRSLSGRPMQVNVPFDQCHICHTSFRHQQGLRRHLGDEHAYRIVCLYCDFECTSGHNDLFREHLASKHFKVALHNGLVFNPHLLPLQLDDLVKQHSSPRAPDAVAPSTSHVAALPIAWNSDT
ncbi:hypothetical protein EDB87DRAFT_680662 [Lactarius vividus]|nr:hypothetical protein EDB87DRAFT_680662 [Lactarius vividus]